MTSDRKAELERLKKQLQDQVADEKLEAEIRDLKAKLEPEPEPSTGTGLKAWLKLHGLWRSFVLIVVGIISTEFGVFTGFYIAYGVGVLMIIGGVVFIPWVREFFGDQLK